MYMCRYHEVAGVFEVFSKSLFTCTRGLDGVIQQVSEAWDAFEIDFAHLPAPQQASRASQVYTGRKTMAFRGFSLQIRIDL